MTTTTRSDTAEGTGRRAGLDRRDMVAKAVELVEREGPGALTMRRLAAELDVTTTTVYWHVGNRDELITEIIRHQAERLAPRKLKGSTPRDRLVSAATSIWDNALTHRAITSLAHQSGTSSLLQHPVEVAMVRELEAAGLTGAAAAEALRSVLATIGGFLVLALRDTTTIPDEMTGPALWATVEADVDPATVAALSTTPDLPALFRATIEAVVDSHLPS